VSFAASREPPTESQERLSVTEVALRRCIEPRTEIVTEVNEVMPGQDLTLVHDPHNPRCEEIRLLRTELMLDDEPNQAKVIAVLSPGAAEGRSQLSAELAIAFAQLGRRTLLVDADLRSPRQHRLFDAIGERGLSQALARDELPFLQRVVGFPLMNLLTSGLPPTNPLEMLATPPASQCADALAIASLASRVLVLSRATRTSVRDLRSLLRRLASTRARIAGAVISHF